jgi:hypothetical protein
MEPVDLVYQAMVADYQVTLKCGSPMQIIVEAEGSIEERAVFRWDGRELYRTFTSPRDLAFNFARCLPALRQQALNQPQAAILHCVFSGGAYQLMPEELADWSRYQNLASYAQKGRKM